MTHPVPVACAAWLSDEFWEDALRPAPWIVAEAWLTLHRVSRAAGVPSAVVAQARGQLDALLRAGLWEELDAHWPTLTDSIASALDQLTGGAEAEPVLRPEDALPPALALCLRRDELERVRAVVFSALLQPSLDAEDVGSLEILAHALRVACEEADRAVTAQWEVVGSALAALRTAPLTAEAARVRSMLRAERAPDREAWWVAPFVTPRETARRVMEAAGPEADAPRVWKFEGGMSLHLGRAQTGGWTVALAVPNDFQGAIPDQLWWVEDDRTVVANFEQDDFLGALSASAGNGLASSDAVALVKGTRMYCRHAGDQEDGGSSME